MFKAILKIGFGMAGVLFALFALLLPLGLRFWVNRYVITPISIQVLRFIPSIRDTYLDRKGL